MDSCLPSDDTVLYARQLDIETQSQYESLYGLVDRLGFVNEAIVLSP
jgi:hypothetical protein